jgi:hypothetical protein
MRQAEEGMGNLGKATDDTTQDLEEQQKALDKARGMWSDYLDRVAAENWRYAQQVERAQFQATQAAENAAFSIYKIERDAADKRSDLFTSYAINVEADTASHYNKLRYLRQDLNDSLADMEWDYQKERREAMDQAPWWIRQALSKEFRERERIAKTGDAKALADYDKMLLQRIRAIDPVYAKELEKLQEQYKHEEQIEKREGRQSQQREEDAWQISSREQQQQLNHQLDVLERELREQREEWAFHDTQRLESERFSMGQMLTEYEHSLSTMWTTTQQKLAELPPLYEKYGYESWAAFVQGFNGAMAQTGGFSPWTGEDPFENWVNPWASAQRGMEYVPRTMPVLVHKGESILPAGEAQQYRQTGGVVVTIQHMTVSGGRAGAREFVEALSRELGEQIGQRSR